MKNQYHLYATLTQSVLAKISFLALIWAIFFNNLAAQKTEPSAEEAHRRDRERPHKSAPPFVRAGLPTCSPGHTSPGPTVAMGKRGASRPPGPRRNALPLGSLSECVVPPVCLERSGNIEINAVQIFAQVLYILFYNANFYQD